MDPGSVKDMVCPECSLAKLKRKNVPLEASTSADQPLYRIHADLSGRKLSSLVGYRYFLVATDDHSRYRWIKLLRKKSETFDAVQELIFDVFFLLCRHNGIVQRQ